MSFELWPEIISGVGGMIISGVAGSIQHRRDVPREQVTTNRSTCSYCSADALFTNAATGEYFCKFHNEASQQQAQPQPRQAQPQRQPQPKRQAQRKPIYEEETVRDRRQYGRQQYDDPYDLADLEDEYLDDEEEEYYEEDEVEYCVHNRELGNCKRCYEAELERRRQLVADQRRQRVQQRQVQRSRPALPPQQRVAKPLPQYQQRRGRR